MWLAYVRIKGSGKLSTIAKVRVDGQDPPVDIFDMQPGSEGRIIPEWSPAGDWIVYRMATNLILLSPDGKTRRILPQTPGPCVWSRDGKTLYQIRGTEHAELFAIDIATGGDRKLRDLGNLVPYSPAVPGLRLSLTPDQKRIVYTVNRPREEIWLLDGLRVR